MELLPYLEKQWGIVGQAPFVFLIVAALAFGAAYAAARWAYQARLDHSDARIKLRDDRIVDLEHKVAELRRVAESPPPKIDVQDDGVEDYSAVIRHLVATYVFETPERSDPEILSGRELPPLVWMNERLAKMGKGWRVSAVHGPIAEIEAA